ncbi:MAG: signal transduction histidine kinase [Candidatus Binatia bacterium]|jgi:signal transduction histidine kinase
MARHLEKLKTSKALPAIIIALTICVYGVTVFSVTQSLGAGLREQILGRDGNALHEFALMSAESEENTLFGPLSEPSVQADVALETAGLKSVLAHRLYSADGQPDSTFSGLVTEGSPLAEEDLQQLRTLVPVTHFLPEGDLSTILLTEIPDSGTVPLLDIYVPLHDRDGDKLLGVAQFILQGDGIAAEFAELDQKLAGQSRTTFVAGGLAIALILGWAFHRLQRTNSLLREQREQLIRANKDLADTARTSAVGAVSAHLIHGLINPLTGIQAFLSYKETFGQTPDDEDWGHAAEAAQRMEDMVRDIVSVIRDESELSECEITFKETAELVESKIRSAVEKSGVVFRIESTASGSTNNRTGNLVVLILINLLTNALHATKAGKQVTLRLTDANDSVEFEVADEGSGVPESEQKVLFDPRHSSRPGGNGIGLAISKQLATHLGANLQLKKTSPAGSVFALTLPGAAIIRDRPSPKSNEPSARAA